MALSSAASRIVRPFVPGGSDSHAWLTARARAALSPAPMKLNRLARITATVGVSARVRTASATDEDASLNPLRNAKAPAQSSTRARKKSTTSGFLDDDAAHLGGDPAHVLRDFHELVRDIAVARVLHGLHLVEHVRDPDPVCALGTLGQAQDLDPVVLEVVQIVQPPHGIDREFGLAADDFQLVGGPPGQPFELVEGDELGGGV